MRAKELLAILLQLGYVQDKSAGKGGHSILRHPSRGNLTWHNNAGKEFPPGLVKKILTKDAGLTTEEAKEVLRGKRS